MDFKMRFTLIWGLFICLIQQASAHVPQTDKYSQKTLLKNWALSRCLAKSYDDEGIKEDANATASAYLEYGKQGIETYNKLNVLVDKYVSLTYGGSIKSEFKTMKCIDLYHSKELEQEVSAALKKNL